MGSVYRKTFAKPLPLKAELFEKGGTTRSRRST